MEILTEERALELTQLLLQNDKNIKDDLELKIPSVDGLATETYVKNSIAKAQLDGSDVDLSGYATKEYVDNSIPTVTDGKDGEDGVSPTIEENKNNTEDVYKLDITTKDGTITTPNLMGGGSSYKSSNTIPTEPGTVGDIVFNNAPVSGGYIGWVYTALGWLGFGLIESVNNDGDDTTIPENALTTADGQPFTLKDGTIFLYANS